MSTALTPSKTQLVVEKSDGTLWGRIKIKGNLITDSANTLDALKKQLKTLALDFENVDISEFDVVFDLTSFFEQHSYLNASDIAARSGINASLMRQYISGAKFPSLERVKLIESAIHEIGKQLSKVKLHRPDRVPA